MSNLKILMNGIIKENPTFVLLLGMCPTLGTTSSALNGITFGNPNLQLLCMVSIMVYSASFMFSWGPICWVLIAEVFPNTCLLYTSVDRIYLAFARYLSVSVINRLFYDERKSHERVGTCNAKS